ncbi:hypothetical protein [Limosilactobacillus ingluviei]|uniref:hypothetical protein n=1 Tax=Limosilactobacillus ingluviei TaxID=148604 RepID=UPI0002F46C56|nr:hypothetical protein [Limosilactobacillus ingluviei]
MEYCPNCGAKRHEGEAFCANCGYKFEEAVAPKSKVTHSPSPTPAEVTPPKIKKVTRKHWSKKWLVVLGLVILLGILIGGWFIFQKQQGSSSVSSESSPATQESSQTSTTSSTLASDASQPMATDLSSLTPQEAAAGIITLGAKSNKEWGKLLALKRPITLQLGQSDSQRFSSPGAGVFYQIEVDGADAAGQTDGYTMEEDGSSIYLYAGKPKENAKPFKVLQADEVVKAVDAGKTNGLENQVTINTDS